MSYKLLMVILCYCYTVGLLYGYIALLLDGSIALPLHCYTVTLIYH